MLMKVAEFYMIVSMSLFPVLTILTIKLSKDIKEQDRIIARGRHIKTKR